MPEKRTEEQNRGRSIARCTVAPTMRHALATQSFAAPVMGEEVEWTDSIEALAEKMRDTAAGSRRATSDMLTAQAVTLDAVFTEMLRRAGNNMGVYPEAAESYMRLALKAQANSRATLEALARLHQPREQIVKHVHVNAGGQAVVADEFHHHADGGLNAESVDQAHATSGVGKGTPLLSQNKEGNGVPVAGSPGKEQVPNARRRQGKRGSDG